jgi:hypothetical protein
MPTAPLTGDPAGPDLAAPTVDEQFYDLICADADLVAAEFDAIVAAEWPETPGRTPRHRDDDGYRASGGAPRAATGSPGLAPPARDGDLDRSARERAPPPANSRPTETQRGPRRPTRDDDREGR